MGSSHQTILQKRTQRITTNDLLEIVQNEKIRVVLVDKPQMSSLIRLARDHEETILYIEFQIDKSLSVQEQELLLLESLIFLATKNVRPHAYPQSESVHQRRQCMGQKYAQHAAVRLYKSCYAATSELLDKLIPGRLAPGRLI